MVEMNGFMPTTALTQFALQMVMTVPMAAMATTRSIGGNGNDQLYGEQDDDILRGGAGDDELYGGLAMTTSKVVMAMTA